MRRARILVADDHQGMRDTAVHLLKSEFDVVHSVNNGKELLDAIERLKPDVCVLDISMPVMSGIEAAALVKETETPPKLVFLSIHEDNDFVYEALRTGAEGYVFKQRMASELLFAVRAVLTGNTFVSQPRAKSPIEP